MDFIKKHYEKIIFSVVLVGLTAALGFIPVRLSGLKAELEELEGSVKEGKKNPFKPLDITRHTNILSRLNDPSVYAFTKPHNLINPVLWQKQTNNDGSTRYIKAEQGDEVGTGAISIQKIRPLHLTFSFDAHTPTGTRFTIIRQDSPPQLGDRKRVAVFLKVGDNVKAPDWTAAPPYWEAPEPIIFTLTEIQGPADNPEGWVFNRSDIANELVTVTREKPYQEIRGYEADVSYPPEGQSWSNVRPGWGLVFAGGTNKVVDIKADRIVLSSANEKMTTVYHKEKSQ